MSDFEIKGGPNNNARTLIEAVELPAGSVIEWREKLAALPDVAMIAVVGEVRALWERKETPDEVIARVKAEIDARATTEMNERAELAILFAKYGPPPQGDPPVVNPEEIAKEERAQRDALIAKHPLTSSEIETAIGRLDGQ